MRHKYQADNLVAYVCHRSKQEVNPLKPFGYVVIKGERVRARENGDSEHVLSVISLSLTTTRETLQEYYSRFGTIIKCDLPWDYERDQSLCVGYIHFSTEQEVG
jgi:RNA recognition motif-containing protein